MCFLVVAEYNPFTIIYALVVWGLYTVKTAVEYEYKVIDGGRGEGVFSFLKITVQDAYL